MPYIKQEARKRLDDAISDFEALMVSVEPVKDKRKGVLNYVFTMMLKDYVGEPSYSSLNDAIGILECCKLEFYRRAVASYEEEKIKDNGDVY